MSPHEDVGPSSSDYLDRLMRRGCFEALWPLFAKATRPAKEMTESYSALAHLRPFMPAATPFRVIHVGDGAHARTGALFALKTQAENVSVDPVLNEGLVEAWRAQYGIRRFAWQRASIYDAIERLNALPEMPVLVTFVHAHVAVDAVLARLRWNVAYTLACCQPGHQLSQDLDVVLAGVDRCVLSTGQSFQVLAPLGQGAARRRVASSARAE